MLSFICCATHFPVCLGVTRYCRFAASLWFALQRHATAHTYTFNSLWNFTSFSCQINRHAECTLFHNQWRRIPSSHHDSKPTARLLRGGHSLQLQMPRGAHKCRLPFASTWIKTDEWKSINSLQTLSILLPVKLEVNELSDACSRGVIL